MQKKINTDLDHSDMQGEIKDFPNQIKESIKIMESWNSEKKYSDIQNILILGMGGSAIGGDLARVIAQPHCALPIIMNRTYTIPQWVDSKTLILSCSYSGDTEETLSAFSKCVERNCPILVISTGGILTQFANDIDLDLLTIPTGYQPRAALGFSFTLILIILKRLGFLPHQVIADVKKSIKPIKNLCLDLTKPGNTAYTIAQKIHTTCPIIYGSEDLTWVVALRFRGQLAENAKMLSFHNHFPEQNHNEIEGWTFNEEIMNQFSIIWIKDKEDHLGVRTGMDISSTLLAFAPKYQLSISQSGNNRIQRLLKLINYSDWISYYAALLNNIDPTPVNRIQQLKKMIDRVC